MMHRISSGLACPCSCHAEWKSEVTDVTKCLERKPALRPKPIDRFEVLVLVSLGVGIVISALNWNHLVLQEGVGFTLFVQAGTLLFILALTFMVQKKKQCPSLGVVDNVRNWSGYRYPRYGRLVCTEIGYRDFGFDSDYISDRCPLICL